MDRTGGIASSQDHTAEEEQAPVHRPGNLQAFASKMAAEGLEPRVIDTFAYYYRQVVTGKTGLVSDRTIRAVGLDEIPEATGLTPYAEKGAAVLDQAVMIILNGGLGTSMGLAGPKSLLTVKDGRSFLAIILERAARTNACLALMNSFSTQPATAAVTAAASLPVAPLSFLQNKFPKILREDFNPATWPPNPELEWNPPGHGDVYTALHTTGMLDRLLAKGITYAFISNSDNLGATLDTSLLGYFAANNTPFMMEVCEKTAADVKGGHLARQTSGRLILREAAQCPDEERSTFEDIQVYRFFNTNNIWINLEFLKRLIDAQETVRLPMILNPKPLDPRDDASPPVYQVETAMGSAISLFEGATAVRVSRNRFIPVKTCNDLLAVRSDMFILTPDHCLALNPERDSTLGSSIQIDLDPEYFGKIDRFEMRFPHGAPSLIGCRSLTVRGDVVFDANVKIVGDVRLTNSGDRLLVIPKGSVISGDLFL